MTQVEGLVDTQYKIQGTLGVKGLSGEGRLGTRGVVG